MRTYKNMGCEHEECEPYGSCQALTDWERRTDFSFRQRTGLPVDDLATDPLAWYEGVTETG
jgi:hypothetical protein